MFTIAAGTLFTIVGTCTAQYPVMDLEYNVYVTQVATVGSGQVYSSEDISADAEDEAPPPSESREDVLEDGQQVCLHGGAVLEMELGNGTPQRVRLLRGANFRVHGSVPVVRCLVIL